LIVSKAFDSIAPGCPSTLGMTVSHSFLIVAIWCVVGVSGEVLGSIHAAAFAFFGASVAFAAAAPRIARPPPRNARRGTPSLIAPSLCPLNAGHGR
jgi:hypothetical protein